MDSEPNDSEEPEGWFDREENARKLLLGLFIGCGLLVLIDVVYLLTGWDKHPYFKWEKWPGFYAVYGFVACVLLVLIAKYVFRPLVMRDEGYYEADPKEKGGDDV